MKRRLSLIVLSMLMASLLLVGCGSGASGSLEEYVSNNAEFKADLEDAVSTPGIDMEIKDNTVICTYTMDVSLDDETVKTYQKSLEESVSDSLSKQMAEYAKQIEKKSGIKGITVEVKYVDKKDNVLFDKSYDSKGEKE